MSNAALLPGISAIVPIYNSEAMLPDLVDRLTRALQMAGGSFEIILVNDGSWDKSWAVIDKLTTAFPWVYGINLMRNYGQHNALLCGIRAAKYELIITLDDDLQNPPEEIPLLLKQLDQGDDVVYGTPRKEQHGLWRDMASQVTKLALQSVMGVDVARKVSAFRAFR